MLFFVVDIAADPRLSAHPHPLLHTPTALRSLSFPCQSVFFLLFLPLTESYSLLLSLKPTGSNDVEVAHAELFFPPLAGTTETYLVMDVITTHS